MPRAMQLAWLITNKQKRFTFFVNNCFYISYGLNILHTEISLQPDLTEMREMTWWWRQGMYSNDVKNIVWVKELRLLRNFKL